MKGNFKELSGQRFGRLKVIERVSYKSSLGYWRCKCDCGREVIVRTENLTHGQVKSCGCLNSELVTKRNTTHGLRYTRLYRIWHGMKQRCYNQNHPRYPDWGGRGISVCEEWRNSFKSFYDWAVGNGYQDDLTIDRIDNNGNYDPRNCRWTTTKEQNLNKRSYKLRESDLDAIQDLHHRGYPDWQIAKELGCSRSLISLRIRELGIRNEHD